MTSYNKDKRIIRVVRHSVTIYAKHTSNKRKTFRTQRRQPIDAIKQKILQPQCNKMVPSFNIGVNFTTYSISKIRQSYRELSLIDRIIRLLA